MATRKTNFSFVPQIAEMHVDGFFRKRLVMGRLATTPPENLFMVQKGGIITWPYFNTIGPATDGVEAVKPTRDTLGDQSFTAEMKEIVKSLDISDTASYYMGPSRAKWDEQAVRQIGRVFAEKVEDDIWTELNKTTSHKTLSSTSNDLTINDFDATNKGADNTTYAKQLCSVRGIAEGLTEAFGDRRNECRVIVMHSEHYKDIETDIQAGFLKADANDPFYKIPGFVGRNNFLFGLAVFINDNVTAGANITINGGGGKTQNYKTYNVVFLKNNAYGLFKKQTPSVAYDRDIEARVDIIVGSQWYLVKSFHAQIKDSDIRIAYKRFSTKEQTA